MEVELEHHFIYTGVNQLELEKGTRLYVDVEQEKLVSIAKITTAAICVHIFKYSGFHLIGLRLIRLPGNGLAVKR